MSVSMSKAESGGSRIKAAGAVLWRPGPVDPRIALIHRERYDDWSFPKGKADPGEHALLTAVREVREETGVRAVLGRRLPNTEYEVLGRDKRVKYWSGRAVASPREPRSSPSPRTTRWTRSNGSPARRPGGG